MSIFTKIINGELPAYKVAENDDFIALIDINLNTKGHTLCVHKKEIDKIFDIDEVVYDALIQFSYEVAEAVELVIACERVGMSVVGLEVPHVQVHLIALEEMEDSRLQRKASLTKEEFEDTARKIVENM